VPTYQYVCTACGHPLEAVQAFSDAPLTVCPECDGRLRKVFSSVGVVFKGSGFYRTDSRSGSSDSPKSDTAASTPASSESKSQGTGASGASAAPSTGTGTGAASGGGSGTAKKSAAPAAS
jgi:putative FmdB family regulatory protein